MIHFFPDSQSLRAYVRDNNRYVRRGDIFFGTLQFIDSPDLWVVFDSRSDYERFKSGVDIQISLF